MRIFYALFILFYSVNLYAYCKLDGGDSGFIHEQAQSLKINLNQIAGNFDKNINMKDDVKSTFSCRPGNVYKNDFNMEVVNPIQKYLVDLDGIHKVFVLLSFSVQSSNKTDLPGDNQQSVTKLNVLSYHLNYNIMNTANIGVQGDYKYVAVGDTIKSDVYMKIKPVYCGGVFSCLSPWNNINQYYKQSIELNFSFDKMTCSINDYPNLKIQDTTYADLGSVFLPIISEQPKIDCSSSLGVATSNVKYHFEAVSDYSGNILKNDFETNSDSAGEVGFQMKNDGQLVDFLANKKFDLVSRNRLLNNESYPLNLTFRYIPYGNKVRPGKVQSKMKVVIDYD
ncbi:hypothetical protein Q3P50_000938 [Salmonella enterica]|nr:hypothetical protein [Salmonella enterica]